MAIIVQNDLKFIYEGKLFVCFYCFSNVEISQTIMPLAMLLVPLKIPQWVGMKEVNFIMFFPIVEKLLNIEQCLDSKFI